MEPWYEVSGGAAPVSLESCRAALLAASCSSEVMDQRSCYSMFPGEHCLSTLGLLWFDLIKLRSISLTWLLIKVVSS